MLPELLFQHNNYTVMHYLVREGRGDIFDLDAPYQRGAVWTEQQQRNLIKSLYMGLPVGAVVISTLGSRATVPYRVVDGKQRILAVRTFIAGQLAVPADWFRPGDLADQDNYEQPDVMVRWDDLSPAGQGQFDMRSLPAIEFNGRTEYIRVAGRYQHRDRTDSEILQAEAELFLLINFAGVAQTDQDRSRAQAIASTPAGESQDDLDGLAKFAAHLPIDGLE